jgi:hypothetical protein
MPEISWPSSACRPLLWHRPHTSCSLITRLPPTSPRHIALVSPSPVLWSFSLLACHRSWPLCPHGPAVSSLFDQISKSTSSKMCSLVNSHPLVHVDNRQVLCEREPVIPSAQRDSVEVQVTRTHRFSRSCWGLSPHCIGTLFIWFLLGDCSSWAFAHLTMLNFNCYSLFQIYRRSTINVSS